MRYDIHPGGQPAYMQLYRCLRDDITAGVYPYGAKLPSKRVIAAETGVSVVTVEHACAILCDEGYIESRQRSGNFVIYRDTDGFAVLPAAENALPAPPSRVAQGDFPFSVFARTMRRVLSRCGEALLVKSPDNGLPELRGAIAAYLARSRGVFVQPEQIVIGSGAEYLYSLLAQFFRGERFALEDPSYEKIRRVYLANGVDCELLRLGPDGIRSDELIRACAAILHVTPFNSVPSGVTASASKRREYVRWAQRRGGYIIEDDFDSEFTISTKPEETIFSLEPERTVIYLNTFSKTIAPSVRVGYLVLPPALTERFREAVGFYSCTVPVFEQYVLAEFIANGDFERHINRVRRKRRREQSQVAKN